MMGRAGAAAAVLGVVTVLVVLGGPSPAHAASSVESGWWTSSPVAMAPDVGDDQLLVQGGVDASQPAAYAGISFSLTPDELPEKLTLAVAPGSASTPGAKVMLCLLGGVATAAHGEPADSGPPVDCATKVEGSPSDDGATYEFDVASLVVTEGALDVAALATSPAERVVFQKPAVDALQSTEGGSAFATGTEGETFDDGSTTTDGALEPGDLSLGGVGSFASDVGSVDLGVAPAPPAALPQTTNQPRAAAPPSGDQRPVAAAVQPAVDTGDSRSLAPFVFVGMAVAAAVLWTVAGQSPSAVTDPGDAR